MSDHPTLTVALRHGKLPYVSELGLSGCCLGDQQLTVICTRVVLKAMLWPQASRCLEATFYGFGLRLEGPGFGLRLERCIDKICTTLKLES